MVPEVFTAFGAVGFVAVVVFFLKLFSEPFDPTGFVIDVLLVTV